MSTKQARGTKRTCQNSDCGERFYDLGRDPIVCPICQSKYVIASAPFTAAAKPEPVPVKPVETRLADEDDIEIDDATESLEVLAAAEEAVAGDDDDTFLEEEEDSGDVSGIIGSVNEGDEEV